MRKRQTAGRGFSLPEVLVVLSIIMLLAVMNIPNMRAAKEKAEEAAAVESAHAIRTSQEAYRITHGSYASSFSELTDVGKGPVLEGEIGSSGGGGTEDVLYYKGYIFRMERPTPDQYTLTAEPATNRNNRPWYETNHNHGIMIRLPQGETLPEGAGTPPEEP